MSVPGPSDLTPVKGRGRLHFHECLGRGGYGEIYRALWIRQGGMDLPVAVKVLNASVARGSDAQRRLKDEARLLGALTHPSILRVYDLIEVRGNVAMIMEQVDGADLDRAVLEGLPTRALVGVIGRVAAALSAAWSDLSPVTGRALRLVHRDIKPENIRITPTAEVKLLDFGVARAAEVRREAQTATNTVMGSYRYMSPERFDSDLEPHPSIDVFALGCILFEGMVFRRLFEDLSMREMLMLSLPGTDRYEIYIQERLAELPPTTDPGLVSLIERLVHRDPTKRPLPGRLATLCDDLVDQVDGLTLEAWCKAHVWTGNTLGPGEWTGMQFQIEDSTSGGFGLPSLDGYPDVHEIPTDGPSTSDATLPDMRVPDLGLLPDGPAFAPKDLASDGPSTTSTASLPADAPTDGRVEDPDGVKTATVDREALRASVASQPAAPLPAEADTRPVALSELDTMVQKVPIDVKDVVQQRPAISRGRHATPAPAPVATRPPVPDPVPAPPPARPPAAAALRAPAGPEVHRAAHEARMAEAEADAEERSGVRPRPAAGPNGAVVANLAVLSGMIVLGLGVLLLWVLASVF